LKIQRSSYIAKIIYKNEPFEGGLNSNGCDINYLLFDSSSDLVWQSDVMGNIQTLTNPCHHVKESGYIQSNHALIHVFQIGIPESRERLILQGISMH
jgi:site-specific DNA-cytosine methylase